MIKALSRLSSRRRVSLAWWTTQAILVLAMIVFALR